jgi:hypothetical protein
VMMVVVVMFGHIGKIAKIPGMSRPVGRASHASMPAGCGIAPSTGVT